MTTAPSTSSAWMPASAAGLDINFCRNPECANFGVKPAPRMPGRQQTASPDGYRRVGVGEKLIGIRCDRCGETATVMSNYGIAEELARYEAAPRSTSGSGCRTTGCSNGSTSPATHPDMYQRFGVTSTGSPRYRCKSCCKTFSMSFRGAHRLRKPEKSEQILKLLINKMPMRRLCEVADVSPKVLYDRITRLALQCRSLAFRIEQDFIAGADVARLHLNTDRQDHVLNWGTSLDRSVITLRAIATADVLSGYILGQHLNYDIDADPRAHELVARANSDPDKPAPFRQYARLWLPHETEGRSLEESRVPGVGGLVHDSYSIAAHFHSLRRWVAVANKVQFSLDQDPGLDRLCAATFAERIRAGTLSIFIVKIAKAMTVAQRKTALSQAEQLLDTYRARRPDCEDFELVRELLLDAWRSVPEVDRQTTRRWIPHPYPTMTEPQKSVLAFAVRSLDEHEIANGLARATLRALDRYFMQVRRKINLLERPIQTAGASFRAWYGYNAYSPRVVAELLDIFRVIYNFHLQGQDRKTPAQRLGVTAHVISLAEICDSPLHSESPPLGKK